VPTIEACHRANSGVTWRPVLSLHPSATRGAAAPNVGAPAPI